MYNASHKVPRITAVAIASLVICAVFLLAGCSAKPADNGEGTTNSSDASSKPSAKVAAQAYPFEITDDMGRKVSIGARPEKIVSLAPANTEILFAIGAGDRVLGVTSYDDYPAEVKNLEVVGDFTGPNIEKVASLAPDLVLATSGVQADAIKKLEDLGATVVVVDPTSIQGILDDITKIGEIVDAREEAIRLTGSMQERIAAVKTKAATLKDKKLTAFIEIGQNPLYTAGPDTTLNELITLAGGENVVTESGFVAYSAEKVLAAQPAIYFVSSGMGATPEAIAKRPGHNQLNAVKNGNVVVLEENLVSRPGPRIVEGLEQVLKAYEVASKK